jgi:hypothetical protein
MLGKLFLMVLLMIFIASCSPELVPVPQASPVATDTAAAPQQASPLPTADVNSTPVSSEDTPMPTTPGSNPLEPLPGEENLSRGKVFIDNAEIATLESNPPQFRVHLTGNLPTPCHHLRAQVSPPDAQNQIQVEVYSLYDPKQFCTAVLQPFDSTIPLGNIPSGKFSVFVNGEKIGELIAP